MLKDRNKLLHRNIGYCARPLIAFVGSKLLSNSKSSEIYTPRISFLYVIYTKMFLYVGRCINTHMVHCQNDPTARSFWYANTITLLCKTEGICPNLKRVIYRYSKIINKSFEKRWRKVLGDSKKELIKNVGKEGGACTDTRHHPHNLKDCYLLISSK